MPSPPYRPTWALTADMLSISTVSAGAAASGYYKEEGYYREGTPEARDVAQWFGKAAEDLGLTGVWTMTSSRPSSKARRRTGGSWAGPGTGNANIVPASS